MQGKDAGSQPRLGDLNPLDPRGLGLTGPLPKSTENISASQLNKLYAQGGLARPIDQIAGDTWGDGWTGGLDPPNDKWARAVEQLEDQVHLREALEQGDIQQLLHGMSLVHFNLDGAGDNPAMDPKGKVKGVLHRQVIPRAKVHGVDFDKDPRSPRFGKPLAWKIEFDGGEKSVHWARVLALREHAKPNHDLEGLGIGRRVAAYAVGISNLVWAVVTTYYSRAAPLIVAQLKEGVRKLTQAEIDALAEDLQDAQQHTIQEIIVRNFEIKVLDASARIPTPEPFIGVAFAAVAYETGIPVHELRGSAAGELASSQEDTRRWNRKVTRRRNNWARPRLREWYELLDYWGLAKLPPKSRVIVTWPTLGQPTAKEAMEILETQSRALAQWPRDVPLPKELLDYEVAENQPVLAPPQPSATPAAPSPRFLAMLERLEALDPTHRIEAPELKLAEQRFQTHLSQIFLDFGAGLLDRIDEVLAELAGAQNAGRNGHRRAWDQLDPNDPAVRIVLKYQAPTKPLEAAFRDAFLEAAMAGAHATFTELGAAPAFTEFPDATQQTFALLAQTLAEQKAVELTQQIRASILDGVLAGEGVAKLRVRIIDVFDRFSRAEAERIARTEAMRAYNTGSRAAMQAVGIRQWRFKAFDGACPICFPLDGQVFDLDDENAPHPPDKTHPQCRCQPLAVVPEAEVPA